MTEIFKLCYSKGHKLLDINMSFTCLRGIQKNVKCFSYYEHATIGFRKEAQESWTVGLLLSAVSIFLSVSIVFIKNKIIK
jgi:hypothetical protein